MATEDLRMEERPELRRPVLISAFRGWNDGGQGATLACGYLGRQWQAEKFAEIDPEGSSTSRRRGRMSRSTRA